MPPSGFEQRHKVRAAASRSTAILREGSMKKRLSIEDFELLTMIGKGSFGTVILVRYKVCHNLVNKDFLSVIYYHCNLFVGEWQTFCDEDFTQKSD